MVIRHDSVIVVAITYFASRRVTLSDES